MAGGGTIVLDEVAALLPATQSKLLRVLEERSFERLGGTETLKIDARLIALTNADLGRAVSAKRFREDLFFRLSVLTIHVPTLRERPADIAPLTEHFLARLAVVHSRLDATLTEAAHGALGAYDWPGNVRELKTPWNGRWSSANRPHSPPRIFRRVSVWENPAGPRACAR